MNSEIDLSQYLNAFLEETKEHLQAFTQALIDLEDADEEHAAEVLNAAFRSAHTVKGMSASMDFMNMEHLCHSMEDLMDELRTGSRSVTPELIDMLLECSTKLEELTINIEENGNDDIDVSEVLSELDRVKGNGEVETAEDKPEKKEKADKDEGKSKQDSEKKVEMEEGKGKTYEINISVNKSCDFKGVRSFLALKNLAEIGKIVKTVPSQEDIENERFGFKFKVILVTEISDEEIKDALLSVADLEKVEISGEAVEVEAEVEEQEKEQKKRNLKSEVAKSKDKGKEAAVKSVRINIDKLDSVSNLVGELVINKSRLIQIGREHEIEELGSTMAVVERTISDLQYEVTQMRMIPVEHVFNRFPKLVRDLYRAQGKEVDFILKGKEIELERTVLDEIVDPIVHLLRNAVDHGIELPEGREKAGKNRKGRIALAAKRETGHVTISVEDDGKGMDPDILREKAVSKGLLLTDEAAKLSDEDAFKLIFMPGFSTAEKTTAVSGRGVGMEVVKTKTEALGGFVDIQSEMGKGTKMVLKLPLTTAIIQALLTDVCNKTYAIPLSNVREIISVLKNDIKTIQGATVITLRGSILPLVMVQSLFGLLDSDGNGGNNHNDKKLVVVVVERSEGRIGLVVDTALEQQEIVVKPPDEHMQGATGLGGFTILGDGCVVPILDIASLTLA